MSLMEMMNVMLKYLEAHENMRFIFIPKMPLELHSEVALCTNSNEDGEDGLHINPFSYIIRQVLQLDQWRQHAPNQNLIMNYLKISNTSIDKVTQFFMHPPEFIGTIDSVRNYFC